MKYKKTPGITSILILVVFNLFLCGCVKTENAINPESLKTWEIYNIKNGLGSDSVMSLAEDKEGNIWVGTLNNGVSKFDGKMWTIYNVASGLIDNMVLNIAQDGYGRMWFGTSGGLSIFLDNKWTNIADYGSDYAILEYKNNKMYQYYDTLCESCNVVTVLFEDNEKNIWFGSEQDLKKLTSQTMTSYTQSDGLPGGGIRSMHQDIWGNIWIASSGSANVVKYNSGNFESISLSTGLSIEFVNSIASDNNGNVWFGLLYWGSIKYNGSLMKSYTVKDGLPDKSVMKILKDKHGYLWFGTMNGGVAKYMPDLN